MSLCSDFTVENVCYVKGQCQHLICGDLALQLADTEGDETEED